MLLMFGHQKVQPQMVKVFYPRSHKLMAFSHLEITDVKIKQWNNISLNQLTIDLGNLSGAKQIKLVFNGKVDFGDAAYYVPWIESFKTAAAQGLVADGTEITPAPYMEVKDANSNWIRPPNEKQIPLPADYTARTFAVDVTDLFPAGTTDFQIRISNFYNITWDYIGIDLSTQENITVQKITSQATLTPYWEINSNSSGSFTKYGDVTSLMQNADDMYVIGRAADQILLRFPIANLSAPAERHGVESTSWLQHVSLKMYQEFGATDGKNSALTHCHSEV